MGEFIIWLFQHPQNRLKIMVVTFSSKMTKEVHFSEMLNSLGDVLLDFHYPNECHEKPSCNQMLWYRRLRNHLSSIGHEFNPLKSLRHARTFWLGSLKGSPFILAFEMTCYTQIYSVKRFLISKYNLEIWNYDVPTIL